jgi:hypothetical protein
MLRLSILSLALGVLSGVQGQTTMCAGCNALQAQWDPTANTGSCLGDVSDPVAYISNFEKCFCNSESQADYASCFSCNSADGEIPIDGLNFGPPASFSSACSRFAADVTSVLQPSGLAAFASVVAWVFTNKDVVGVDMLGNFIFQNVEMATAVTGGAILTDDTLATETGTPALATVGSNTLTAAVVKTSSTSTATNTASAGSNGTGKSDSSINRASTAGLFGVLAIAISAAVFI